jgi:hypothetical protein
MLSNFVFHFAAPKPGYTLAPKPSDLQQGAANGEISFVCTALQVFKRNLYSISMQEEEARRLRFAEDDVHRAYCECSYYYCMGSLILMTLFLGVFN